MRPCIGMDKNEIVKISREIGNYETSIQPYEECCTIFTPPHPATRPQLELVESMEQRMPRLAELEAKAAEEADFQMIR